MDHKRCKSFNLFHITLKTLFFAVAQLLEQVFRAEDEVKLNYLNSRSRHPCQTRLEGDQQHWGFWDFFLSRQCSFYFHYIKKYYFNFMTLAVSVYLLTCFFTLLIPSDYQGFMWCLPRSAEQQKDTLSSYSLLQAWDIYLLVLYSGGRGKPSDMRGQMAWTVYCPTSEYVSVRSLFISDLTCLCLLLFGVSLCINHCVFVALSNSNKYVFHFIFWQKHGHWMDNWPDLTFDDVILVGQWFYILYGKKPVVFE